MNLEPEQMQAYRIVSSNAEPIPLLDLDSDGPDDEGLNPVEDIKDSTTFLMEIGSKVRFGNRTAVFDKPGLYRFCMASRDERWARQFIVDDGDVVGFCSSLAWCIRHGDADNAVPIKLSTHENVGLAVETIKSRNLRMNCGSNARFTAHLHKLNHGKSRVAYFTNAGAVWGAAHVMVELLCKQRNKWILFDLDTKCYFEINGEPAGLADLRLAKTDPSQNIVFKGFGQRNAIDCMGALGSGDLGYLDFTTDYTLRTERGLYQFLGEALGGMVRVNEL
jgi:hypothetical protein